MGPRRARWQRPEVLVLWRECPTVGLAQPGRSSPRIPPEGWMAAVSSCGRALPRHRGLRAPSIPAGSRPSPYESSPKISFTKAAISVFLVLCKVKKGCSWRGDRGHSHCLGSCSSRTATPRKPSLTAPPQSCPPGLPANH